MKATKLIIQTVLVIGAIFLVYKVYSSVMEPVKYKKVKDTREKVIIAKLLNIKELQVEYKVINKRYTNSFDTLKEFYLNGQMPLVLKKGSNDTLTEERALELGLISRDTTFINIKDTLLKEVENFNINTIDIVPFTNGKSKFDINSGLIDRSNFKVPVFEVSCLMKDYLSDIPQQELLENRLKILKEDGKFPGLKLGSMDEPTTDGNWQ